MALWEWCLQSPSIPCCAWWRRNFCRSTRLSASLRVASTMKNRRKRRILQAAPHHRSVRTDDTIGEDRTSRQLWTKMNRYSWEFSSLSASGFQNCAIDCAIFCKMCAMECAFLLCLASVKNGVLLKIIIALLPSKKSAFFRFFLFSRRICLFTTKFVVCFSLFLP